MSESLLYIVVFVGVFLFSLLKDKIAVEKKRREAELMKMEEPTDPFQQEREAEMRQSKSADSIFDQIEKMVQESEEVELEENELPQQLEEVVNRAKETPRPVGRHSHTHREMPHHHQETYSPIAPQREKREEYSSPFLSMEDDIFSEKISSGDTSIDNQSSNANAKKRAVEAPLQTEEDARRAFIYSEIWNRKYC